jgi:mRNA-degrading endonuclease toxin of MazEF toxin-antitoxin module
LKQAFVPESGDFIWLTFDPHAGREQAGRRPALVLSPRVYNAKSGLALACPITNQAKGYPFEVAIPAGHGITGVIQLRNWGVAQLKPSKRFGPDWRPSWGSDAASTAMGSGVMRPSWCYVP